MKSIVFVFILSFLILDASAQVLSYSPNRKLEKTVSAVYYNTEFIYLTNITSQSITVEYELIENNLLPEWSATICTNMACLGAVPKFGSLGTLKSGDEGYYSFNFSANETLGNGQLRYLITSPEMPTLKDTVTFDYTVTEDGKELAGPWARVNFSNQILTVLLANPNTEATAELYNASGHLIWASELNQITSYPLRKLSFGVYFVIIRDEKDRVIREKIAHG
jgi:hypothetical protein